MAARPQHEREHEKNQKAAAHASMSDTSIFQSFSQGRGGRNRCVFIIMIALFIDRHREVERNNKSMAEKQNDIKAFLIKTPESAPERVSERAAGPQ